MNTPTVSSSLKKAQAVLNSLFEACHELDLAAIETNLTVINSYLCDAIEANTDRDRIPTNNITNVINVVKDKNKNVDLSNSVFDALISARKIETLTRIALENFFTDKDNDNPQCLMFGVISDYAEQISDQLKDIESKVN